MNSSLLFTLHPRLIFDTFVVIFIYGIIAICILISVVLSAADYDWDNILDSEKKQIMTSEVCAREVRL